MREARYLVLLSMATTAKRFKKDGLSTAHDMSLGVQHLQYQEALTASIHLYAHLTKGREQTRMNELNTNKTLRQVMMAALRRKDRGEGAGAQQGGNEGEEGQDVDGQGGGPDSDRGSEGKTRRGRRRR